LGLGRNGICIQGSLKPLSAIIVLVK